MYQGVQESILFIKAQNLKSSRNGWFLYKTE